MRLDTSSAPAFELSWVLIPLGPCGPKWAYGIQDIPASGPTTEFFPYSNSPSLQALCIFSLANTEAGQAVINIMGIGVDTIDMVMATQSSW